MTSILVLLCLWSSPRPPLPPEPPPRVIAPERKRLPPLPPPPPPVPAEEVLDGFIKAVEAKEGVPQSAKDFIRRSGAELTADARADFIPQALAVLDERFKAGLDAVFDDRPVDAANVFEELSRESDLYVACAATAFGGTSMVETEQVERCAAMIERLLTAHPEIERYTLAADQIRFLRGYCQVHSLEYELAAQTFQDFLARYPNAPERLRTTAAQILTELSNRAPGRMGDVRDLLNYARRRIGLGRTDEPTQQRQNEAVALLDALIEEAEEQEKNQGHGEGGGGGGRGGGSPQGNQRPGGPAGRSALPGGEQRVGELRQSRARPGEAWGRMPPKQRDQILQALQRRFPSQYRELLEQYYAQLAKDAGP